MNPRRKKRLTIILSILAGVTIVAGLSLYALSQNIDLFYTPSEIIDGKGKAAVKPQVGQRLRIGGMVVEGSVQRNQETLAVEFDLVDIGPIVTVSYTGILSSMMT